MNKKYITCLILALFTAAALSSKTKLTIKNTVGGDFDELADYDLYSKSTESDVYGEAHSNSGISFGDRFQIDLEDKLITARLRLETVYQTVDDSLSKVIFAPGGFVHFTPVSQFGIAAGNNFYKHFAISSGYLAAADDTTKYARLLTDSLGEDRYFGNDSVSVYSNGFAGGLTSDWNFDNGIYAKFAGGGTFYPEKNEFEKAIDFGVNGGITNLFDLGFTAHNLTEADRKFGAFAGYTGNENLIANIHFYYNFTSSDYLPEERVNRNNADEFKKQTAKYALGFSGGYKFVEKELGIYGDVITALTNEYIGTIKYYDSDGNLIDTETTTIVRGGTVVKYKNGKAKRTDEFTHEGIPFYMQLRLTSQVNESVEASFNFKLRTMLNASNCRWITLYPRIKVDLADKLGTIGAGLRIDMNAARYEGISGIAVPLTYTYKFKKKF
ncbi:hypothetical protein [Treponema sp.]|uniref:hypothetical protein n=1 Tax=Treponema sp. TaxID=166 RepID=UPI00388ED7A4